MIRRDVVLDVYGLPPGCSGIAEEGLGPFPATPEVLGIVEIEGLGCVASDIEAIIEVCEDCPGWPMGVNDVYGVPLPKVITVSSLPAVLGGGGSLGFSQASPVP